MTFDRRISLRRIKPQRQQGQLHRRDDSDLPFLAGSSVTGRELLLDTCVYIGVGQDTAPIEIDKFLKARLVNHSTVALSELTHLFGALDPNHSDTRHVLRALERTIDEIPPHRLETPSSRTYAEAGMLAGLVTRLIGQPKTLALLNDALLYLQAIELGCDLLTGNVRDFDWFDQLLPSNNLLLYR